MRLLFSLLTTLAMAAPAAAQFDWESVRIGGGGFVTGLLVDPASPDRIYARTDVGGSYALDRGANAWQPLNDALPRARKGDASIEAFALDPSNPHTLYLATGMYTAEWWRPPGSILKSTDGGRTWSTPVRLSRPDGTLVKFGGNETKRQAGERIAVDPFNPSHILVGTRADGLFQSLDAGATFQPVSAPFDAAVSPGITSIVFDRIKKGHVSLAVYGDGVYVSSDAGRSWVRTEGGPAKVNRLTQGADGVLWAACSSSPFGNGVLKFADGVWTNVTPKSEWPPSYSAVAVDPTDASHVLVATGEADFLKLFRSRDGGVTWVPVAWTVSGQALWTVDFMKRIPWTSDVKFDPKDSKRIYLTDWYGVWTTDDVDAATLKLTCLNDGLESTVIFDLLAIPGGRLLTACADLGGFVHNDFDTRRAPTRMPDSATQYWQDTFSIDYCRAAPQRVVRVGAKRDAGEGYWLNVSDDGGLTWRTPAALGRPTGRLSRVAVSSTDPNNFVILADNKPAVVTQDGGETFTTIASDQLPVAAFGPWYTGQPLAADLLDGNRFYYVHPDGRFFVSNDSGKTWSGGVPTGGPGKVGTDIQYRPHVLRASTVRAGRIYVANDVAGLFRSDDAGKTFVKVASISRPGALAVGPAAAGSEALYVWGTVGGQEGIFQSLDDGANWQRVSTDANPFALTQVLAADPVRPNRIYVGTSGRGVHVGVSPAPTAKE